MLFHTPVFVLGFLPICLMGCLAFGRWFGATWALRWLVVSSLFFYGWWNPRHLPLLLGSIAVNHAIARSIWHSHRPRALLTLGVGLNLALLGWFKYANFLLHIVDRNAPELHITLPLAISFFTFQQIMFLVDTARGATTRPGLGPIQHHVDTADAPWRPPDVAPAMPASPRCSTAEQQPPPRLLTYAAFVTFFPHLIAGPIVRPANIIPQFEALGRDRCTLAFDADGLLIFLLGLCKKLVLADMFGGFADTGFAAAAHGATLTFFEAWYATLSYALQIYFDFSGYSDMAIGLARILRIHFPLNFDSPYQATNISEFWRRWHITLGAFLRDYLYIPLGGSRRGPLRQVANLMATMLLCGLWHGAAWSFVFWGGLHGLFLVVHAQYRRLFRPLPALLGQAITLLAVTLAWVPFRAASLSDAVALLRGMAGLNSVALPRMLVSAYPPLAAIARPVTVMPFLGDARTLSFPEVSACLALGWLIVLVLPNVHRMTGRARHWSLTGGFALSVQALFFAPHVAPFLYFQF